MACFCEFQKPPARPILKPHYRLADRSAWLRKERGFAFYGDIDLIPTEHYTGDHATRAMTDAAFAVGMASRVIHDA